MNNKCVAPLFGDILSIPSNPEDLFTLLYPIGIGGFGKVYKALHNSSDQIFAIKIIDYTKNCINDNSKISFNYESIQQETSVMRLVSNSDYVVKYYGSYYSRRSNTVWLILEYCDGGSAVDLMMAMDRTLNEIEVATITKMALKGLVDMHNNNLIHRDIKGSNILLKKDGSAKLGDFGVGIQLTDDDYRTSKKGSPYWMSPQVVLREKYDTKTDIWSLGITCVELVEGEPPNGEIKPLEVMEKIGKTPPKVEEIIKINEHSEYFVDFVKKCLEVNPKNRPSAKELLEHPFIKQLAKEKEYIGELISEHIEDIERYREEEEKRRNNQNGSENYKENEHQNQIFSYEQEMNNKMLDDKKKYLSQGDIYNNEEEQNGEEKNLDQNDYKDQANSSVIIHLDLDENENNENDNEKYDTMKVLDNKNDDGNYPGYKEFIKNDGFIWDDKKYEELMKDVQLKEIRQKKIELEKKIQEKKNNKKEEEYNSEQNSEHNSPNEEIIKTPTKEKKDELINSDNTEENFDKINSIKLDENKEDKVIKNQQDGVKKDSNITQKYTKAESRIESNNIKILNNTLDNMKKNNIFETKYIPPKLKINLFKKEDEDDNPNDISNIDNSDSEEEKINPIQKEKKFYGLTTEKKINRKNFFDKIEESCNILNKIRFDNNQDDDINNNVRVLSFKKHKKYFN